MTRKINRELTPGEICEISAECEARDNRSSTPPEEWRAVAEGDGWTLCKLDTSPEMFALLGTGEALILDREDVVDQLGRRDAIAIGCGPIRMADGGTFELVAIIHDDGDRDDSVNLYIGKGADGAPALLARDNAAYWIVGSEDDAERNRNTWETIAARCDVASVINEVRKLDADLADWLTARHNEAIREVK